MFWSVCQAGFAILQINTEVPAGYYLQNPFLCVCLESIYSQITQTAMGLCLEQGLELQGMLWYSLHLSSFLLSLQMTAKW